ncbi:unnamed protein product [Clavelina lepadiformis]|uniref:[histone H3]-lysine(4) N-trimethyltransferase n=1 Tax=Clavelina lepadiformis TaxID=159417 RepID=A0ABP0FEH0_CLALP
MIPHGGGPTVKRNFKLLVDPQLKKGQEKLIRFDGEGYSCSNHGQRPVVVRDPRSRSTLLWGRKERVDLPVPRYKVDEWYIGAVPPREITFSCLNDNITIQFMQQLCSKFGKLERVKVYKHPKTDEHMGLAKVAFASIKSAAKCVEALHHTSIMGNVINAEIDCKGELLKRLHHKILKGEILADTMPDVIKHTQERPLPRKSRRKSSHEDPRRKSTDSIGDRQSSIDPHSHSQGPKTPPLKSKPSISISEKSFDEDFGDIHFQDLQTDMPPHPGMALPVLQPQPMVDHQGRPSAQLHRISSGLNLQSYHSLESGYASHPNSASLPTDQSSPFNTAPSEEQFLDSHEHHVEKNEKSNKNKQKVHEQDKKRKGPKVWTEDLENRIHNLLTEQNQKYNLPDSKIKKDKAPFKQKNSENSQLKFQSPSQHPDYSLDGKLDRFSEQPCTPEDLEDGECSGDDQSDEVHLSDEKEKSESHLVSEGLPEPGISSPPPPPGFSKGPRDRFSRSPSPRFMPGHSPPHMERTLPPDHPDFDQRKDGHGRFPPGEFFHPRGAFPNERFRPPSPGRRSPEFDRFSHNRFEPVPRSPTFDRRRRPPSPFDHLRRRSPGFEHHRFCRSPGRGRPLSPGRGRPLSPGRGRPPSPGFMRRHDFPPGHPEFDRRRSPSPRFERQARGLSPRRFDGPIIRREFDGSPRRERFCHNSPREMDRRRREMSPRFADHERRRHSPGFRPEPPWLAKPPPSPETRHLRDQRELPLEFRERRSRIRSPSPEPHGHIRLHKPMAIKERHLHRSARSSSSEAHNMMTSPNNTHSDQVPYSPGDLPIEDSTQSEDVETIHSGLAPTNHLESDSGLSKAAQRKQRESSDHDAPKISLDERLRAITGEPEPESPLPSPEDKEVEEHHETMQNNSEGIPEDMEISSGGGSEADDLQHLEQQKQHPTDDFQFRNGGFRPVYPGPTAQHWPYGAPRPNVWNGFDPRFNMHNQGQAWGPRPEHGSFPSNMHGRFPTRGQFHPDCNRMDVRFDSQMLPPPPPGWDRPWVQGSQHPPPSQTVGPGFHPAPDGVNPHKVLGDCVLNRVSRELKDIVKRDLNRKVIESMAFKIYESWWDEQCALKNPKPIKPAVSAAVAATVKTEPVVETLVKSETKPVESENKPLGQNTGKMPSLLNTFDPLNWAKGSLEMDGFRIGLGFRSAISKMPSFRLKKRSPSPTSMADKKSKMDTQQMKDEKEKRGKEIGGRKRIYLDSEGEEEDESDQETSDEEEIAKHNKSRVLDVDDVFSSSSSESDEEESSDEDDDDEEESDEEEEMESKDDDKNAEPASLKRPSNGDEDLEPSMKRHKVSESEDQCKIREMKIDNAVAQAALSLSELQASKLSSSSPPVLSPTGTDVQKQPSYIHPKKRRLLSKDDTRNLDLIAELSDRLRSEDCEVTAMSDKEKAALEILADMKGTPERRLPFLPRLSESSDSSEQPLHPITPGRQLSENIFSPSSTAVLPCQLSRGLETLQSNDPHLPITPGSIPRTLSPAFGSRKHSVEEERAVEALLSIKQSQPPIPSLSPITSLGQVSKKDTELNEAEPPKVTLTQEQRDIMAALAEEHNYFALSPSTERKVDATVDPHVLRIAEEHSYSCPPSLAPKPLRSRSKEQYGSAAEPLMETHVLSADDLSSASAAERVKLHHRIPKPSKKTKPVIVNDFYPEVRRKRAFKPRSEVEEMSLLSLMWMTGLDLEDMRLLRYEYEQMLTQTNVPGWANDTHWVAHPVTNIPDSEFVSLSSGTPVKKKKARRNKKDDLQDVKLHKSGCARTEGYYKVADKTKQIQRRLMYRQAENTAELSQSRQSATSSSNSSSAVATEKSREARHMMRRIASEFGADASDLLKYNQLMFRKKSVKFKRSRIHGWGLFAEETIGADEMVIEYVGELVRSLVADRREVDYTKRGIGSSYLFRIDGDHIIDATKCGNYARFMNHSCNPSCYAKVITVEGAKKIVIYSKDVIKPSDEITYDYKFPIEDVKIPCYCGAPNCRGTLN